MNLIAVTIVNWNDVLTGYSSGVEEVALSESDSMVPQ